jgi:hypothetical protein
VGWVVFLAYAIGIGIAVLVLGLIAGGWWEIPILAVFGYALYVLLRNRARRSAGR